MKKLRIIGIGELVWDMLPAGRQLGGAPVNFAYWCNRLGAEGFPVSAVGEDEPGETALGILAGAGLDTSYIQHNARPTGRVEVTLSGDGIPQYEIIEGVAWDELGADPRTTELVATADALCWGSLAQRSEASHRAIRTLLDAAAPDCLKVFDINIRQRWYTREILVESLRKADVLKLNEEELPLLASLLGLQAAGAEAIARLCREFSLRYVIYTAGASHSEIHAVEGLVSRLATPKVQVADTVGAGDSFSAAFITSLLQGEKLTVAHRKAVETAARVCTLHGAIPHAL